MRHVQVTTAVLLAACRLTSADETPYLRGGASQPNTTELVPMAANSTGPEMPGALLAATGAEGVALGAAGATVSPEGAEVEAAAQSAVGVGGCTKYSGRNCYGSGNNYESCQGQHGGYSSAPDAYSYRTTSLWDCTHICNGDWSCHAVVYMPSQSKCYFRNYVNIGACAWSSGHDHFDTYVCK